MPTGKCPKCGAAISIEHGVETVMCSSCGSQLSLKAPSKAVPSSVPPPTRAPVVPVVPPPAPSQSPYSRIRTVSKNPSKAKPVVIGIVCVIALIVIVAVVGQQSSSGVSGFEKWVSEKKASFSIAEKESVLSSIAAFPADPSSFAREAEKALSPIRAKCQSAVTEVREKAAPILKELAEKQIELERKQREFELSERTSDPLIREVAESSTRVANLCAEFEKHVRARYEELYVPTAERYNALRKAVADKGVLWRYDSKVLVKRYFDCGGLLVLQCGSPDQYYSGDYTGQSPSERETVVAIDAATGKERWVGDLGLKNMGGWPPRLTHALVIGRKVYVAANGPQIVAFDADSGKRLWDYKLPDDVAEIKGLRKLGDRLLIVGASLRWQMPILVLPSEDGRFTEFQAASEANVASPGILDCFDIRQSRPGWVATDATSLKPFYTQDQLVADLKSKDEDLSRSLSLLVWDRDWRVLQVIEDAVVFYAAGHCYSFDRKAKTLRSLFEYTSYSGVTPVIAKDLIFYVTKDGSLHAWSLTKNQAAWSTEKRFDTGNPHGRNRLHTDGDTVIYAETGTYYLVNGTGFYALDAATGKELWRKRLDMEKADIGFGGGQLVLLQDAKQLHIANPRNGKIVWSHELPSRLENLPAPSRDEGTSWRFGNDQATVCVESDVLYVFVAFSAMHPREGKAEMYGSGTGTSCWSGEISPLRVTVPDPAIHSVSVREYGSDWSLVEKYLCIAGFTQCPSFIDQYDVQQTTRIVEGSSGKVILQYQHFGDVPERGNMPSHWDQFGTSQGLGRPTSDSMVQRAEVENVQFKDFLIRPDGRCLCRNARSVKAFATTAQVPVRAIEQVAKPVANTVPRPETPPTLSPVVRETEPDIVPPVTPVPPAKEPAKPKWGIPAGFRANDEAGVDEKTGLPKEIAHDQTGIVLVLIPAGEFMMGSPAGEANRNGDELQHPAKFPKPFYMGKYELTRGQFAAFVKETGYRTDAEKVGWSNTFDGKAWNKKKGASWEKPGFIPSDNRPVVCVSWNDASEFCAWLSKKTGSRICLPTEARWEYACRAGTQTSYQWGDGPDEGEGWCNAADMTAKGKLPDLMTFKWQDKTVWASPVGKFKPNAWGLYDMCGNVWELCADWYGENYYKLPPMDDPQGPGNGRFRVLRGGSWACGPGGCRSAVRFKCFPGHTSYDIGFRLAVDVQ